MFLFRKWDHKIWKVHYLIAQQKTSPLHYIGVMTAPDLLVQADEYLLHEQEKTDPRLLLQMVTTDVLKIDAYKAQLCA
ncbi:hypothetical protein BQ6471_02911 [Vibrio gazogenes]|nr:hypothetical protein BQ6471_02911 [Vibrio gazogenes]